jgi:SAM-dependent methyltransferase/RimJ/RimL family protein N-acetyltransferase
MTTTTAANAANPVRGPFNAAFFTVTGGYLDWLMRSRKQRVFADLPDEIVELGSGVGANFRYLRPGTRVIAVEPNPAMHARLRARAARHEIELELRDVLGEQLDLPDASTDMVMSSLVLCTVSDPAQVLAEVRRVLRPGGRYAFVEHVGAKDPGAPIQHSRGRHRDQGGVTASWRQAGRAWGGRARHWAYLEGAIQVINCRIQARKTLLADAEAARRAKQARSDRQRSGISAARRFLRWLVGWLGSDRSRKQLRPLFHSVMEGGKRTLLRDGSEVLIRPIQSADAPLLADGFARLSAKSRQMRFLTAKKELSAAELRYFTDVDHHDHEALGALNHADGRGVGIARYIRSAEDPQAAEIAVTVVDEWQGRGLGTELVAQLSDRARHQGIRRFTALVAADNVAVAGLLRTAEAELVRRESATLEYEITLVPRKNPDHTSCRAGERSLEVTR